MTKNLDALAARIERVALDPDDISAPFSRIFRPILARLGVEPDLQTAQVSRLVERIRMSHSGAYIDATELMGTLEDAKRELEANVSAVERACVVNEQPMVTCGAWLRRMYEVIVRAERAIDRQDADARALIAHTSQARLLPPLTVRTHAKEANGADGAASARRLVELELASVDRLVDAADAESELLGRKRRLLEAARQALLGASAAMPLEKKGCETRLESLAQQIARIDRLEAAGVSTETALSHQLRQATTRGERDRAYATLCAMQTAAVGGRDERLLSMTSRAMETMSPSGGIARAESLARSANEMFGLDVSKLVQKTYTSATARYKQLSASKDIAQRELGAQATMYFSGAGATAITAAAVAVDGCFDLGGALLPVRTIEYETHVRAVTFPTPDLALLPATDIRDLPDAIIEDPRMLVLDLAAGRLLARRFIAHEQEPKTKIVMRGEVRAYVLDGSGSMLGPRARMRDAIVASELLTLRKRMLEHAKLARVMLFYRYFSDRVEPSQRVDSVASVDVALQEVLGTARTGGTDIENALVATIGDIARAQANDPELSRAQIVIVTDGLSAVDEERVSKARETLGAIPIGLSVVALGEQNDALRTIVAKQRAKGERAFYHFISDPSLQAIVAGEGDPGGAIHPPPVAEGRGSPEALASQIGELVEEIATQGHAREVEALDMLDTGREANLEAGLVASDFSESEVARARSLYKERSALERQFDRWFPAPKPDADAPEAGEDIDAAVVLLSTVAEMIAVVGGSDLQRMADAIDLLERLLPDARLTPARYQAVVMAMPRTLSNPLSTVRAAAHRSMLNAS